MSKKDFLYNAYIVRVGGHSWLSTDSYFRVVLTSDKKLAMCFTIPPTKEEVAKLLETPVWELPNCEVFKYQYKRVELETESYTFNRAI